MIGITSVVRWDEEALFFIISMNSSLVSSCFLGFGAGFTFGIFNARSFRVSFDGSASLSDLFSGFESVIGAIGRSSCGLFSLSGFSFAFSLSLRLLLLRFSFFFSFFSSLSPFEVSFVFFSSSMKYWCFHC